MLFMKEQRPAIPTELWKQGSGAVNAHLGKQVLYIFHISVAILQVYVCSRHMTRICVLFLKQK